MGKELLALTGQAGQNRPRCRGPALADPASSMVVVGGIGSRRAGRAWRRPRGRGSDRGRRRSAAVQVPSALSCVDEPYTLVRRAPGRQLLAAASRERHPRSAAALAYLFHTTPVSTPIASSGTASCPPGAMKQVTSPRRSLTARLSRDPTLGRSRCFRLGMFTSPVDRPRKIILWVLVRDQTGLMIGMRISLRLGLFNAARVVYSVLRWTGSKE